VEEPLATTSIIPMYFLAELASSDVKVVLTGQGADEPLGGYTRYKSELVRYMVPGIMRKSLKQAFKFVNVHDENISRGINTLPIENEIDRFLAVWEVFNIEEIEKLISVTDRQSSLKISYWHNLLNCKKKKHPVERMMALDTRLNLADDLLNYTDKITMNFALECRVPMLDLELVSFIEALPYNLKLNLRKGKIIHKQFASEILPDKIINRKKKGFLSPTNNWFKNEADVIKEILLSGGTNFSKLFNQTFVAEIIRQQIDGYKRDKQIFLLLSIYFWLESLTNDQIKY
jgi:asparagine synthase (glutamine-hydrolysing)